MSKFLCDCGYVMNLSNSPSDYEFAIIPEERIEYIAEKLEKPNKIDMEIFFELIDEVKMTAYKCPNCMRLHIDLAKKGIFTSFIPKIF